MGEWMKTRNIYDKLMDAIGNPYGVCGLMGNIKAESNMNSINMQNSYEARLEMNDAKYTLAVDDGSYTDFATDRVGYGLCQWTSGGRKAALLAFAKQKGASIGDADMQIEFLIYELNTSYKNVLSVLKNASSVKEASDVVVTKYERPADQSAAVLAKRASYGQEYFNELVSKEETEVKKLRINVHAGHNPDGKVACGAIGFIKESTENRNVKNEVIRLLRALGHTVYDCTVDNGTSASNVLTNIVKKCNSHEVDLDVSIHFNAGASDVKGNGKTTGTEVFVYNSNSKAKDEAERVCKAIAALGFKNRGVKYSQSLYVLKKTTAPAMLIECCFVDDKDDVAMYDFKAMAEAIVYGITGQKYSEPTNNEDDAEASENGAETATGDASCMYRLQVGAYKNRENAEKMQTKLKYAGFDAVIVKA